MSYLPIFLPRVIVFSTIIAYGLKLKVKVSQYGYDLGFKGQTYFKSVRSVFRLVTPTYLSFSMAMIAYSVQTTKKVSDAR